MDELYMSDWERLNEYRDILLEDVCVDEDALDMIIGINGDNPQTYKDVLYYYTGCDDFDCYNNEDIDE